MRCRGLIALAPWVAVAAVPVLSTIRFEEIAVRAGVMFTTESCPTPNKNQPETMVAGVAIFDFDRNGYPDIFFVNGAAIPSLEKEGPKYKNRLFHNNGNLTFTDSLRRPVWRARDTVWE